MDLINVLVFTSKSPKNICVPYRILTTMYPSIGTISLNVNVTVTFVTCEQAVRLRKRFFEWFV